MKKSRRKEQKKKSKKFYQMELVNPNAGGIDIGSEEIFVSILPNRDKESVRSFGAFTADLYEIANWLEKCGIDTVAMESTSVYWIPLYEILEEREIEVYLVNARHVKNVPGRKSDVSDCQWLMKLHTFGLLTASFCPSEEIVELRELVRHRQNLVRRQGSEIQRMQKALNLMNLKLSNVLSDITGVTGMKIIRSILAGERDPKVLAQYRDRRCLKSEEEIAKSLEGHYKTEQLFMLEQALQSYEFFAKLISDCDEKIQKTTKKLESKGDIDKNPPTWKKKTRKKKDESMRQELYRICGVDLVAIDGIQTNVALTILSNIALDMSKWKTAKHFTSWLGLAPKHEISGGKILKNKTMKNSNRAANALRQAAVAVGKTRTSLGAFYRKIKSRSDRFKVMVATARKLAVIIYNMLKNETEYRQENAGEYEKRYQEIQEKRLKSQAKRRGYKLVPMSA